MQVPVSFGCTSRSTHLPGPLQCGVEASVPGSCAVNPSSGPQIVRTEEGAVVSTLNDRRNAHVRPYARVVLVVMAMVLTGLVLQFQVAGADPPKPAAEQTATAARTTSIPAAKAKPGAKVSAAQLAAMTAKLQAKRLAIAEAAAQASGTTESTAVSAPASTTTKPATQTHGDPSALTIGRNNQNTRANTSTCGTGSTLAEPAAANEGPNVYFTGNLRHQEFSTNGGGAYTCAAAYPAGPAAAPTAFGDTDVIYEQSRGVTFHSVIYVNAAVTDGIVRIFVRRNVNLADNCFYDVDFDPTANVLPDYPHLGLSNDFLYLTVNRVGNGFVGATIRRLPIDQLFDCVTAGGQVITFNTGSQRILTPGHGARDVMYLAWVDTTSRWRVFSWSDNSTTVLSTFVAVGTMTFGDADCRGGTNNVDWSTALNTSIVGFGVRTAIGNDFVHVWTAVAPDASHPNAYVQGAMMRIGAAQNALTLVQQPQIWFANQCVGLPNVGANDRGDQGISIALGGANGGGGPAVRTAVGMKDQFNPGPGGFFFQPIATATHNSSRFGDYFPVRRQAPCGQFFAATGYGLNGGTALANVNARYVEFGRGRDNQCYLAWRNAPPAT